MAIICIVVLQVFSWKLSDMCFEVGPLHYLFSTPLFAKVSKKPLVLVLRPFLLSKALTMADNFKKLLFPN